MRLHGITGQGFRPWTSVAGRAGALLPASESSAVRIRRPLPAKHERAEHMLRLVRECRELSKQPRSNLFLGWKTMDAPPKEEDGGDGGCGALAGALKAPWPVIDETMCHMGPNSKGCVEIGELQGHVVRRRVGSPSDRPPKSLKVVFSSECC